jgi:peptide/nickel transport system permease protein
MRLRLGALQTRVKRLILTRTRIAGSHRLAALADGFASDRDLADAFVASHSVPADPVAAQLGQRAMEDPTIVATFRQEWGPDKPLPEQYLTYLRRPGSRPTWASRYAGACPRQMTSAGTCLPAPSWPYRHPGGHWHGIPFGVASAVRRNHWLDHLVRGVSLLGVSSPVFWLGLVAMYIIYFRLGRLDLGMPEPTHLPGRPF